MLARSIFLILLSSMYVTAHAVTLKSLAQKSSVLLAISENDDLMKKCKLTHDKISALSSNLQAEIDKKIQTLSNNDFKILDSRSSTCLQDCSCAIYAYAYEARGKSNKEISEQAAKMTAQDRQLCISKIKDICGKYLR